MKTSPATLARTTRAGTDDGEATAYLAKTRPAFARALAKSLALGSAAVGVLAGPTTSSRKK